MLQETTNDGVTLWTRPNLFGTIGNGRIGMPVGASFIPLNGNGDILDLKEEAAWKGLNSPQMQFWAYNFCAPLASVIDRCTNAWINGRLAFRTDDGDPYTLPASRRVRSLFMKPNPMQNYHQYFGQQKTYAKIYGFCPVYMYKPKSAIDNTYVKYMWNLNPYFCTPVYNEDFNPLYEDRANPIKEWIIDICGYQARIPAAKILLIRDGYMDYDETGLPLSKVAGLDWAVSNICAAMEADNVLLRKKGPLGFLSHDPSPDAVSGYVAMTPEEKLEVQKDLNNYGLTWSQWQFVVTRQRIKWNPISFNVKDLDTKATIKDARDAICDRFNYPAELMAGKDATYENRTAAEKWFVQNVTMPEAERDDLVYSDYFAVPNMNIYHDYSKIPILQENVVSMGEGMKYLNEAYLIMFQNNLITLNQWRKKSELETVAGDDIYYNSKEYQEKYGQQITPEDKGTAAQSSGS